MVLLKKPLYLLSRKKSAKVTRLDSRASVAGPDYGPEDGGMGQEGGSSEMIVPREADGTSKAQATGATSTHQGRE
jgi:hypothetical protein